MRAILLSACVLAPAGCGGVRKEGFISTAVLMRSLRDADLPGDRFEWAVDLLGDRC
jgi:hypothetical protein